VLLVRMTNDNKLATSVPPAAIFDLVFAGDAIAKADRNVIWFERDEISAVDAAVFHLPSTDKNAVAWAPVITLEHINERAGCGERDQNSGCNEPLLFARPSVCAR